MESWIPNLRTASTQGINNDENVDFTKQIRKQFIVLFPPDFSQSNSPLLLRQFQIIFIQGILKVMSMSPPI